MPVQLRECTPKVEMGMGVLAVQFQCPVKCVDCLGVSFKIGKDKPLVVPCAGKVRFNPECPLTKFKRFNRSFQFKECDCLIKSCVCVLRVLFECPVKSGDGILVSFQREECNPSFVINPGICESMGNALVKSFYCRLKFFKAYKSCLLYTSDAADE